MKPNNRIQLLRHATLVIQIGNGKILVDPMLSAKNEMDPIPNCGNDIRIPMVDLPVHAEELNKIINDVDAVAITHLHRDHWDTAAQNLIPKNKLIYCQPADTAKIKEQGFLQVTPVDTTLNWKEITISRTQGQHGTGEIGQQMGEVSGFVFRDKNQTIYVAGDTIWCPEVEAALQKYKPEITILNAGGAQFLTGGPITMTSVDILKVQETLPHTKVIAVHMDTVNHCFVKRSNLKRVIFEQNLTAKVIIPEDGQLLSV
ncbi:hypothetical protein AHMF7605_05845 [Adhaeribacter arboris]|uniref:Metallo-beta-lactamase domain-containing protein n=2 Tax=Adhaeribacter arboris TaxID=2072846 RepID=A0A2T2YNY6_9BACT|nr:hypothetical protein AHMF7605_05845 [Adhaeribacter arboris]